MLLTNHSVAMLITPDIIIILLPIVHNMQVEFNQVFNCNRLASQFNKEESQGTNHIFKSLS